MLELSDNDLTDSHGKLVLNWLKAKSELRDYELWQLLLRQRQVEKYIQRQTMALNMNYVGQGEMEVDSLK